LCLIGLALDVHPRFALVVAANRDEYFARPAAGLDWWRADGDGPWLLGGRDLSAGGTWMGLSAHGRLAMLTNVRDPQRHRADAPSRGALVPAWLGSNLPTETLWPDLVARACNPVNLLAGDLVRGQWWWGDDRAARPRALAPGVHGLSNATLGAPWPKVQRLERAMIDTLSTTDDAQALTACLFAALADRWQPADAELPDTGVGLVRERMLAPAFIGSPDGRYGTRCSTVLVGERVAGQWQLQVAERTFDAAGRATQQRTVRLDGWPAAVPPPVEVSPPDAAAAPFPGARCPPR
jgi:uncharacterized protein with NRDE domain